MSQPIPSYNEIIAHTIEQALCLSANTRNENAIAGFCQLQGPTGGGKSSSLYRSPDGKIPPSLEYVKSKGLQAIFVTHRWNILQEIYRSATNKENSSVHARRRPSGPDGSPARTPSRLHPRRR